MSKGQISENLSRYQLSKGHVKCPGTFHLHVTKTLNYLMSCLFSIVLLSSHRSIPNPLSCTHSYARALSLSNEWRSILCTRARAFFAQWPALSKPLKISASARALNPIYTDVLHGVKKEDFVFSKRERTRALARELRQEDEWPTREQGGKIGPFLPRIW